MKLVHRFDEWVNRGPFTPLDLGIYRVIFAVCAMWISRDTTWIRNFPDSVYQAPPGPFELLSGFPSHSTLIFLEIALVVSLTLLGLGLFTKPVSFLSALLLFLNFGITYSLGKIDHTFLTVFTPLVLAFANWGDRFSLDSWIRKKPVRPQVQWPLRYLALALALAFFTAAGFKAGTGWLNPATQATQGYFYYVHLAGTAPSPGWLTDVAEHVRARPLWELLDWFTIILEGAFIVTFPWWRALRLTCAFATQFHVGVLLMLGIVHVTEAIVYGAFVSWGLLFARDRWSRSASVFQRPGAIAAAVALFVAAAGLKLWLLLAKTDWADPLAWSDRWAGSAIVLIAGVIGFVYLVHEAVGLFRNMGSKARLEAARS